VDPHPVGRQDLLLDVADGEDLAAQSDLSRIATSLRTGRRVASDASAVTIVDPADGPSFGWRRPARARESSAPRRAWVDASVSALDHT
jgi:hypothetical protein